MYLNYIFFILIYTIMYCIKRVKFGSYLGYCVSDINKIVLDYEHLIYMYDIKKLPKITVIASDNSRQHYDPLTVFEIYVISEYNKHRIESCISKLINVYKITIINLSLIELLRCHPTNAIECDNYNACANAIKELLIIKDNKYSKLMIEINQFTFIFSMLGLYSILVSVLLFYKMLM